MEEDLSLHGGRVTLAVPRRGDKRRLVGRILAAAREALGRRLSESASQRQLLDGVATAFGLEGPLNRIEVYDNSHIQGTNAVGAMIVAGPDGLVKNAYRKFTIRGVSAGPATSTSAPSSSAAEAGEAIAGGDDYAMMREVLQRRFARALKEDPERDRGMWPDLVLIDGGLGQLKSHRAFLTSWASATSQSGRLLRDPTATPGASVSFCRGERHSLSTLATPYSTFCSVSATRRTALRSARTEPNGQRRLAARRSMRSLGSGRDASGHCCTILARREPSPVPALASWSGLPALAKPLRKRFMIISTPTVKMLVCLLRPLARQE